MAKLNFTCETINIPAYCLSCNLILLETNYVSIFVVYDKRCQYNALLGVKEKALYTVLEVEKKR
jgi:hypothetical protein